MIVSEASNGDNTIDSAAAEPIPPLLVSDVEAARLLGISRAHLHRLRAAGKFPDAIRLGRALRFDRGELAAWAAAKCPDMATWRSMRASAGRRSKAI